MPQKDATTASTDRPVDPHGALKPTRHGARGRKRLSSLGNSLMRPTRLLVIVPCIGLLIGIFRIVRSFLFLRFSILLLLCFLRFIRLLLRCL